MANIKQFLQFMSICNKHKIDLPEKVGFALRPIIDDIIFDVREEGEIVTHRIYEALRAAMQVKSIDVAKAVALDFALWLKGDRKRLKTEDNEDDWDALLIDEIDLMDDDELQEAFEAGQIDESRIDERRARTPRLRGRALKMRKAKSEIMSKLNKVPAYQQAQKKLLMIATREARKIARAAGIPPNLVAVDKVIVRKDSVETASTKKPDQKTTKQK